jgi:predicted DNA-binding protein YlxM (UPF0122 family)
MENEDAPGMPEPTEPQAHPEIQAERSDLMMLLNQLLQEELTDKQRMALQAVAMHGIPMEEVARKMGMQRNALYKLLHDARKRLKQRIEEMGLRPEAMMATFEQDARYTCLQEHRLTFFKAGDFLPVMHQVVPGLHKAPRIQLHPRPIQKASIGRKANKDKHTARMDDFYSSGLVVLDLNGLQLTARAAEAFYLGIETHLNLRVRQHLFLDYLASGQFAAAHQQGHLLNISDQEQAFFGRTVAPLTTTTARPL